MPLLRHIPRVTSAHVLALVAPFVALGGTAFAAKTIITKSSEVKDARRTTWPAEASTERRRPAASVPSATR